MKLDLCKKQFVAIREAACNCDDEDIDSMTEIYLRTRSVSWDWVTGGELEVCDMECNLLKKYNII